MRATSEAKATAHWADREHTLGPTDAANEWGAGLGAGQGHGGCKKAAHSIV